MNYNIIYNNDCIDIMKDIKDKEIDLVLTDPPYGIEVSDKKKTGFMKSINKTMKIKQWDNEKITPEQLSEIFRISKNQVIFGWQYFCNLLEPIRGFLIWDKGNGKNYFADFESAWINNLSANRIIRYQWCGAFKDGERKVKNIHPTQKPVELFEWILLNYSKENDLILDAFSGSASIALACLRTNRRFISVEKDKEYYEKSVKRLEQEKINLKRKFFNFKEIGEEKIIKKLFKL